MSYDPIRCQCCEENVRDDYGPPSSEFVETDNYYLVFDAQTVSILTFDYVSGWVEVEYEFYRFVTVK